MASKKRGQNEGSIFQRDSDGLWVGRISLGYDTVSGKRKQKTFYGKTKDEVRRKLTEAMRGNDLGLNVAPKAQTVKEFLNHWLEHVAKPRVRETTYRSYEQIIRNHLIPGLGRHTLQKLTPQHVQAFLNEKGATGISVEHLRRVLRAALSQAVKWDLVPRNVATLVDTPKKARHEFAYFRPEHARAFLCAVKNHRHEALYTVAVAVGLRIGEALGLRWQDVDLVKGTLSVNGQLQRVKGKASLVEPKTARARRTVPLPPFAVTALKAHKARQTEQRVLMGPERWKEGGFVFTSEIGTPADARNVRRTLSALVDKANETLADEAEKEGRELRAEDKVPQVRFHDLRHTCASLLLAQGTDPRTIMETLGHSQITLTLNTYSHVIPALQREAADKMQAMLGA